MLSMEFSVDMAVWQDGITFQSALASKPAKEFELPQTMRESLFAQTLNPPAEKTVPTQTRRPEPANDKQIHTPVLLSAQEKETAPKTPAVTDVPEIPASLMNVEDLTPFVVSADTVKPGSRLNEQLQRTTFSKKSDKLIDDAQSPYNMSEEKAKARETARNTRTLKGPGDAKIFPMNTAARYRDNQTKFGVAQPLTVSAADQAKQLRIEEMRQQAKAKTINEINTSLTQKPGGRQKMPVDIDAIRSQVSTDGFGYQRDSLPLASSQKVSPAASWFPEAMTRQLDAYEAAKKVAAQYGAPDQKTPTDLNV